jgi:diaminopimelate epimerase
VLFRAAGRGWDVADLRAIGPAIERHDLFPRRVNVQLAVATGRHSASILIWERGAGETLASGSSACAVAAVGVRLGLLRSPVRIKSPGGSLRIQVGPGFELRMRGSVVEVCRGRLSSSWLGPRGR